MGNNADQEMFRLLSEWIKRHETENQGDKNQQSILWDRILALFEAGQTTELGLLQTLTTLYQNADRLGKAGLIYTMEDLICVSTTRGGYGYPELFWLVLESNILFEFTDISDVGRLIGGFLCKTGGAQLTRSYLVQTLLGKDTTRHANAFMAFYATGHSLQSLRIVMQVAPEPNESNAQLYVFIYGDAWAFLVNNKDVKLSNGDKVDLIAFFTRGLTLSNHLAVDYCQKALAILGEMTQ
jgi:hypothetical protein